MDFEVPQVPTFIFKLGWRNLGSFVFSASHARANLPP
jgi:hypothetical protein